jgi:serine/threonine protein kinase
MGVVYKARQIKLNRIVAVKTILAGNLASETDVKRFLLEAQAAANLQHPNIVAIHEVGEFDGQHYFSMDYVEGKNLADVCKEGPLPIAKAAQYLKTIAEAVHFAHQRGTLHRDLKPQNVLIDTSDQPRVTDFGLAKQLSQESSLTLSSMVMGSPSYMSPEQAAGKNDQVSPASDVYSLGAILYQLLTGRAPFSGASALEVMRQVREDDPAAPSKLNGKVPADLETICLKCLEKKPELRYASARALAEDLERFLNHEPILAQRASLWRRTCSYTVRHPWALTGAASIVLVMVVGLLFGMWEQIKHQRWQLENLGRQANSQVEDFFSNNFQAFLSVEFFVLQILPLIFFIRDRVGERLTGRNLSKYALLGLVQIGFGLFLILRLNAALVWTNPLPWKWLAAGLVLAALTNIWFGFRLLWHTGQEYRTMQAGPATADQQMVLIRLVKRYPLFLILAAEAVFCGFYAHDWSRFLLCLGVVFGLNLLLLVARMLWLARGEERIIYLPPLMLSGVMLILGLGGKALRSQQILLMLIVGAAGSVLAFFLVRLERTLAPRVSPLSAKFQRIFGRFARWGSYGVRALLVFLVTGYLVENWRGNRAWAKTKAELMAKGAHLDWEYYRPKPVPDEQNMMKVPIMETWFRKGTQLTNSSLGKRYFQLVEASRTGGHDVPSVKLVLVAPEGQTEIPAQAPGFDLTDLQSGYQRFASLFPHLPGGRHLVAANNQTLIERPPVPGQAPPAIYLRVPTNQGISQVNALFQQYGMSELQRSPASTNGPNVFMIPGGHALAAADLIRNTDAFNPEFGQIREALRRPGCYLQPTNDVAWDAPIMNFVAVRTMAQIGDARARSHLLLNRPEEAWRELSLVNDFRRCLDSNSWNLVSAMIDVAVAGLFVQSIEQGYTLHGWSASQYAEIQRELEKVNLIPICQNGFMGERAATLQFLDLPRDVPARLVSGSGEIEPNMLFYYAMPEGWIYQNMRIFAQQHQMIIESMDVRGALVSAQMTASNAAAMEREFSVPTPYNFFASMAMPNYAKATTAMARNQTRANLGACAFALERYRVKNGNYPAKLEDLTPEFMHKLPHDVVNGEPLKYRRETPERFILYSVGWDLKDDGGKTSERSDQGDWVWKSAP